METTQPMNLAVGGDIYNNPSIAYTGGRGLGQAVGKFFSKYGETMLKVLLLFICIALTLSLFVNTIADIEVVESNAYLAGTTAAYANVLYHQRCKSRGGCCKTCPFISEDDPRVVIFKQMEQVDMLHGQTKQAIEDAKEMVEDALLKEKDGDKVNDAGDSLATTWRGIVTTEVNANNKIRDILNQLKDLDKQYAGADSISVELIDAKNRAIALSAAAVIQKNILFIADIHLNSQIMMRYIQSTSTDKQKKIMDYDERVRRADIAAGTAATSNTSISASYNKAIGLTTDYTDAVTVVSTSNAPSQDIVKAMSVLMSKSEEYNSMARATSRLIYEVADLYTTCKRVRDAFSNDLPGKMDADKVTSLIESGDYETAIIKTALESDIVANHQKFAKERSSFESGGGIQSVRDHDPSIGDWVGLFGRPSYRKSDGTSAEISKQALKAIPSEYPDQMMSKSSLQLGSRTY